MIAVVGRQGPQAVRGQELALVEQPGQQPLQPLTPGQGQQQPLVARGPAHHALLAHPPGVGEVGAAEQVRELLAHDQGPLQVVLVHDRGREHRDDADHRPDPHGHLGTGRRHEPVVVEPVQIEFPATGFFCQLFPIRGKGDLMIGRTSATLTAGGVALIPADAGVSGKYSDDYEYLVLRINACKLTEKLAALTGAAINEPLRIEPQQNWRHPASQMLQQYIPLLVDTLSDGNPPFPEWWIAQTEQLLMTLFLCGHRHNYSHLLEQDAPDAAARQVRRAEEFIVANAERAVTLEELAEVTGVSGFSLFSAFKKHRGYSPMEFVAQIRPRQGKIR